MGVEVVGTDFKVKSLNKDKKKWRNQNYPNLPANEPISSPPFVVGNPLNTSGSLI
jgi:hypothetical protein